MHVLGNVPQLLHTAFRIIANIIIKNSVFFSHIFYTYTCTLYSVQSYCTVLYK